jgi:hypothetical protein
MAAFTKVSTAWPRNFRPQPNNFGALFNTLSRAIGTGGVALTGTATTTVYLGVPAARTFSVESAGFQGPTAADGASAITAQLIRNNAGTPVTLTAANSLKAAFVASDCTDWPITATGANRTCAPGDTLRWEVVAVDTVGTVPVLVGVVEIAIQS